MSAASEGMAKKPEASDKQARRRQHGCAVVPAYREAGRIGSVVRAIRCHLPDVIVIDDGSPDATAGEAEEAGAIVVKHECNKGKGIALNTGFEYARAHGFDYAITLDADGQHDPADIPRFIEAYVRTGIPVLVGNRMADVTAMPFMRKMTNRFMSGLLSREMRQYVPDTQCGYRLYRCDVIPYVSALSERYAAESEVLLRVADRGIRIDNVAIKTIYGDQKSEIRPFRDAMRFFVMLQRYRGQKRRKHTGAVVG